MLTSYTSYISEDKLQRSTTTTLRRTSPLYRNIIDFIKPTKLIATQLASQLWLQLIYYFCVVSIMPHIQADCKDNQLVNYCQSVVNRYNVRKGRILHLGCGAGYVSFMLTKIFEKVLSRKHVQVNSCFNFVCMPCKGCWFGLLWTDDRCSSEASKWKCCRVQ